MDLRIVDSIQRSLRLLPIRERVKKNKVVIEHVSTKLMIANPLTKCMSPKQFRDHVIHMGLGSILM